MAAVFRMFTIIYALLARTNMAATGKGHRARVSWGRRRPLVSTRVQHIHEVIHCRGGRCEKIWGEQGWLEKIDSESESKRQSESKKEIERGKESLQTQQCSELIRSDSLLISQLKAFKHKSKSKEVNAWTRATFSYVHFDMQCFVKIFFLCIYVQKPIAYQNYASLCSCEFVNWWMCPTLRR